MVMVIVVMITYPRPAPNDITDGEDGDDGDCDLSPAGSKLPPTGE